MEPIDPVNGFFYACAGGAGNMDKNTLMLMADHGLRWTNNIFFFVYLSSFRKTFSFK